MKALQLTALDYKADSSHYFEKIRTLPLATLLDSCSADHEATHGRYDIMTAAPSDTVMVTSEGQLVWEQCNTGQQFKGNINPFDALSEVFASMVPIDDTQFPFSGGVAGFWSYELNALIEPKRALGWEEKNTLPLMYVGLFWWAIVTDHCLKTTTLLFHPDIVETTKNTVLTALQQQESQSTGFQLGSPFEPTITFDQYKSAFDRIQAYILAGDCYEVNLTQEFTAPYSGDSWAAYRQLKKASPSPYSAYLAYPGMTLLSHSPERFIRVINHRIETHPIKGTIARGDNDEHDRQNALQLAASEKDRAENLMIVDLLRNDLGKVCTTGSVEVPKLFALESYANVHHLVSSVTGQLRSNVDLFHVLSSVFPGGSITGAPKIRAMEIIRELETVPRSAYCGSIGYISSNNRMDTSIAIRTLVADEDRMHCWGGGAIVADSNVSDEYDESLTKVSHLMAVLNTMGY